MSRQKSALNAGDAAFLSGGGEMARLIGETDWARTPLGPIDAWPQSLRTTVSLCLASNFPINIIWGPEHCQIYNDGYRVVCGAAHPQALGEPYTKTWASAWPAIGAPFEHALTGQTSFLENQRMFLFRNGYLEETFFTFSLSPIRDESNQIGGLFHPVTETTASMLAERRTRLLRDLNASLGEARSVGQVFDNALAVLGEHVFDLPFVLLYALDAPDKGYRLAGTVGLGPEDPIAPPILSQDALAPWPVEALAGAREPIEVVLPPCGDGVVRGPYDEPPHTALAFAITAPDAPRPPALMVVGASARLPLDEAYRGVLDLLASALSAGLASARGYEEARQHAEKLAALDQAKTAFFSNVSHEFRTPLTLMLGPIEDALEAEVGLPPDQRERLSVAHRNALRLLKLVNALLDFSRVEAGRSRAIFQPTDLAALTAELASNFRSACERAGLTLTVDCPPLPQPVNVDREMWEKIVLNLLSNAFKFTLRGSIGVRLTQAEDRVQLVVEDTGLGIAGDQLPRIFERFHRIEGQGGRTHEGSGIGLALVDELARLHGGDVSVRSQLGRGSAFTVDLPLGVTHLPRDQVSARDVLSEASAQAEAFVAEALRWLPDETDPADDLGPPIKDRPRVILADDNTDMRAYVKRLLQAGGYDVQAVSNGREALLAALAGPAPDLVLTDVMMPELDGFGLLAALRAEPRLEGLLVILLSARAGEEARVEGRAAGADDYLVKPFSARELRARVDGAVRLSRQRRQAARREEDLRTEMIAERGRAALRQSQAQLEFALEAGRLGSWEMDIATGRILVSDQFQALFGASPEDRLEHYDDLVRHVHHDDRDRRHAAVQRAIASGEDLEVEYRIQRPGQSARWVLARGRATYEDGRAVRIAGVTVDINELKAAEARQKMLLAEVDHRAKNTLASVQSIAMQTLRRAPDSAAFAETFIARIHALSRAHELLTASAWQGAGLEEVIRRTVRVHLPEGEQDRVILAGPAIRLGPNASVTVNMAFHELATNASKYGALSTPDGRLDVSWSLDAERRHVVIGWRETGGPTVLPPRRKGFGSRLLQQALPRELGGEVDLAFTPEGLRCAILLPLSAKVSLDELSDREPPFSE